MKLCMIGTGYVGLVSGTCFSDLGNDVICVDKDLNKINLLKKGKVPIYEPGLSELVIKNFKNKRLKFSTDLKKSILISDIIFICVGTPNKKGSLKVNLSYVYKIQISNYSYFLPGLTLGLGNSSVNVENLIFEDQINMSRSSSPLCIVATKRKRE